MSETWEVVSGYRVVEYSDPMIFKFDPDTKAIEKITKQTLVSGEKNSQYIRFETDRYFDGIDLTGKRIQIIYLGSSGLSDINEVVNVECTDTSLRFGWVVPGNACFDPGDMCFSIEFIANDYVLKSRKYDLNVTEGLNGGNVIPEPEEGVWYIELQERCDEILTKAETASTNAANIMNSIASPTVAPTAASMEDTSAVYVYTGSEDGYTYGNWYYYDAGASEWVSGGVYASTTILVDETLRVPGRAAEAVAVRNAIQEASTGGAEALTTAVTNLQTQAASDHTRLQTQISQLSSDAETAVHSETIINIIKLTRAEYEGITAKNPETLYIVQDD